MHIQVMQVICLDLEKRRVNPWSAFNTDSKFARVIVLLPNLSTNLWWLLGLQGLFSAAELKTSFESNVLMVPTPTESWLSPWSNNCANWWSFVDPLCWSEPASWNYSERKWLCIWFCFKERTNLTPLFHCTIDKSIQRLEHFCGTY